jgi:pimeloyl-ACP methyl ester carboxylesterase
MGQRFTAYFFELPGHGQSTPYPNKFESRLVPPTVAAFMDAMGHKYFNLMGFSFGGLLALRTLEILEERVERVILLSPLVSKRALLYSPVRQWGFRHASSLLKNSSVQDGLTRLMHSGRIDVPLIFAMYKVSNIEKSILESKDALRIPQSTLDVLAYTMCEIFNMEYAYAAKPFRHQCYFGMSTFDDMLDYETTLEIVRDHFVDLTVQAFSTPYHQPPEPPTFEWLINEFAQFLDLLPGSDAASSNR